MNAIGLYEPGSSLLHRAPAGLKLFVVLVCGAGSVLLDDPWQVAVALLVVVLGYLAAGLGPSRMLRQVRPLLWLLVVVGAFHLAVDGWDRAVVVVGVIAVLVLLAALVTLTTRTSALVDTGVRLMGPLRRFGVEPERAGLLLALSIRSVPVVVGLAQEVRDAQRARGLTGSPRAYAVPLIVRSLRHADRLGEALVARGADD
jgi:biotin transport system permease protein